MLIALLISILAFACKQGGSSASSDANASPAQASSEAPANEEELPNLPTLERSYFKRNADGSGLNGIPRPDSIQKPPKGKLFNYKYFRAHVIPRESSPGEDINVYQPTGGLAYVGGGEATYYAGIYNQYLLLDVGTSASKRDIVVINMVSGDTTYRAAYHGDYAALYGEYLVHLSPTPANEDCTLSNGLKGKTHQAVWAKLSSPRPKVSPQRECLYVE